MSKETKKTTGGLPDRIRPTAETMQKFWGNFFKKYAVEIKPFQNTQASGLAKSRRHTCP